MANVGQWVADTATQPSASTRSSHSTAPSAAPSTVGSARYVPPAKRRQRANLRWDVEIATLGNDLASAHRDAAKHQGPNLPTFYLPFYLKKAQLTFLQERFPRTTFRISDDRAHDHPIAHTETMIATKKALRMVPPGHTIIDLFGSPKLADELNASQARSNNPKTMFTYNSVMTEKDELRKLGWGPLTKPDGSLRRIEGPPRQRVLDQFQYDEVTGELLGFPELDTHLLTWFCGHTLYYLSDEEIVGLLAAPGSRIIATIHRHANSQGKMFMGECTYAKTLGMVEQVNSLTGERYVHRDLSFLWDSTTKVQRVARGAYTWTFQMVTEDTWIVMITGCSPVLDERYVSRTRDIGAGAAACELNEHAVVPTPFPHPALAALPAAKCVMVGGIPVVTFTNVDLPPVKLTCPELYEYLAVSAAGKPRDSERLRDLFALARSHISNGSEFPGKKNFVVESALIPDHVMLAFVSGLGKEVDMLRALEGYRTTVREHQGLLSGAAIVATTDRPEMAGKSVFSVARRINSARRQGDIVSGFLDVFSEN